ncbi:hypothetical protein G4422_15570 [Blautia wexlerae]|nr:hypothetical protein [Blautia wexlerae]NSF78601.1 hypothetical protein [Blautia wexlerae]
MPDGQEREPVNYSCISAFERYRNKYDCAAIYQYCCFLDLLQRKQTVRFIAHIASHHITEKISRQTPLPCIDQDKSLIQFLLCLR